MKKTIVLALSTLALASALPAAAAPSVITADGFLRSRGIMANLTKGKDEDPDLLVDTRLRLRLTFSPTEYVKVVYFGEIDYQWGDASYGAAGMAAGRTAGTQPSTRNQGGGIGGDTVNLETKQLYAEVKFPNTPLTVAVGLQGIPDNWDNTFLTFDMAALKFNLKAGMSDVNVFWSKFGEGNRLNPKNNRTAGDGDDNASNAPGASRAEDDIDLYGAQIQLKPIPALKLGADLYYYRNQGSNTNSAGYKGDWFTSNVWTDGSALGATRFITAEDASLYYAGLNAAYNLPFLSVSGWGMYNFGTVKLNRWRNTSTTASTTVDPVTHAVTNTPAVNSAVKEKEEDVKLKGIAASGKVQAKFAGAAVSVRGIYYSAAGTNAEKSKAAFIPWGLGEPPNFGDEHLMIMTGDLFTCTYGNPPGMAMNDAAYTGFGLLGAILSASYSPPALKDLYIKSSAGMFRARSSNVFGMDRQGKNLGTEVAARVGYKFMGSVDVSLNAATVWLGDFYDETVAASGAAKGTSGSFGNGKDDPDRPYVAYAMMQVPF